MIGYVLTTLITMAAIVLRISIGEPAAWFWILMAAWILFLVGLWFDNYRVALRLGRPDIIDVGGRGYYLVLAIFLTVFLAVIQLLGVSIVVYGA